MADPMGLPPMDEPCGRPPMAEPCLENGLTVALVVSLEPTPEPLREVGRLAVDGLTPPLVMGLIPAPRLDRGRPS